MSPSIWQKLLSPVPLFCILLTKIYNQTRGSLGRVCATGMCRSLGRVEFPKYQTAIFVEWKELHIALRKVRKTAANKSIIARNRTLTSKEFKPWNKNGSKSTNRKLQTVTFWTLWNEHLLLRGPLSWRDKSGRHSKNYCFLAGCISISRVLRRSWQLRRQILLDYYTIPPATQAKLSEKQDSG